MHFTFAITLLIVVGAVYCAPPKAIEIEGESKSDQKPLNVTDKNEEDIQLPSLPAASMPEDDEGYQSDSADALRQLYWYAHYYHGSSPHVMTLTDSQIAWINSLHPEVRDQYLRNAYIVRVGDSSEPKRVESIVARDPYNYIYHVPYVRKPVSLVVEDMTSTYDYISNEAGFPVIPASYLPNMCVVRYDSRKNAYEPHNYYLSAVYHCDPGYFMLDSGFYELFCSRGQWVCSRGHITHIVDDPIATYDYSCSPRHYPFIKAPRLPNMQVQRYDRRQNPNSPHNYYLTAVYRCKDGYEMRDTRFTELHCRKQDWVGVRPICDRI